jgi:hypothetical protein
MEWGELATHLGMSRAMLDFVRKGRRNLSFPALRRLEDAEREAGTWQSQITHHTVSTVREAPAEPYGQGAEKKKLSDLRREVVALREGLDRVAKGLSELLEE